MRKNVKIISQKEGISRNFLNYKTNEEGTGKDLTITGIQKIQQLDTFHQ